MLLKTFTIRKIMFVVALFLDWIFFGLTLFNFYLLVLEWHKTNSKHKNFTFNIFQIQIKNDIELLVVTFTIRKIMFVVGLFLDLKIIQLFLRILKWHEIFLRLYQPYSRLTHRYDAAFPLVLYGKLSTLPSLRHVLNR
jgi:hypothetical protein